MSLTDSYFALLVSAAGGAVALFIGYRVAYLESHPNKNNFVSFAPIFFNVMTVLVALMMVFTIFFESKRSLVFDQPLFIFVIAFTALLNGVKELTKILTRNK